jgi:hypothetical protein
MAAETFVNADTSERLDIPCTARLERWSVASLDHPRGADPPRIPHRLAKC